MLEAANPSRRCVIVAACLSGRPCLALAGGAPAPPDEERPQGPIEVDVSDLPPEHLRMAHWKDKPIWILKRSPEMLRQLASPELLSRLADPTSTLAPAKRLPEYAQNSHRSIKPEVFVGVAICPHAGCVPIARLKSGPRPEHPENWPGGFACQCHFATFDLAGRVFRGKPTEENIEVPRHMYLTDTRIVIGKDADGVA